MMDNGTPWLAQYTNAWGFELKEGRESHYTNDYLFTPVGDPYGFMLFNRYMELNSGGDNLGEPGKVITTEAFSDGQAVIMDRKTSESPEENPEADITKNYDPNSVYELLESNNIGYFRFHPVVNNKGTQYYLNSVKILNGDGSLNQNKIQLSTVATEFTFNLSAELMKPYFDRAGYVGGLTKTVYESAENKTLVDAMKKDNPQLDITQLMAAQKLVYNLGNIVPFETGYYRLHSPLGLSGVDPVRYASGYTHKIELKKYEDEDIPMHFYEMDTEQVRTFTDLKDGFTFSHATRGDLPIVPVEKDPASIFYFKKKDGKEGTRENFTTISTEGLYAKGVKGRVNYDHTTDGEDYDTSGNLISSSPNLEAADERAKIVMTDDIAYAQELFIMDIGGGIMLIHDNETGGRRAYLKYLSFDYSNDTKENPTIYDLKMTHNTHTDHAKWCMQPVQKTAKKGVNEMGLKLDLHRGGDGYYYATFYAPFDVLLTDAKKDTAYVCNIWDTDMIHLKKVGKYNTADNGYKGSNQYVPAGTPVIIRSSSTSVVLALPKNEPASTPLSCIFKGEYLEQLLDEKNNGSNDVYTFGLPVDGISKVSGYNVDGEHNGELTAVLPHTADKGVGFFVNANPNREAFGARGGWIRNNRYVYGNRIYYRADAPSGSRRQTSSLDFIPVVFDDDDEEDEPIEESLRNISANGYVYDLQGRCVATPQEVAEGVWRRKLASGIYILNGRKILVK